MNKRDDNLIKHGHPPMSGKSVSVQLITLQQHCEKLEAKIGSMQYAIGCAIELMEYMKLNGNDELLAVPVEFYTLEKSLKPFMTEFNNDRL